MNYLAVFRNALVTLLIFFSVTAFADVTDTSTERRLSIPGDMQGIAFPREDWVFTKEQRRPGGTAVYYMLASESRKLFFSVFIDKTTVCASPDTCLESALKNIQYKDAKEMLKSDDRQFKVAQFYLDNPQGLPIKQANLLASGYVNGQWIDIHLSASAKERPEIATLLEFLKTVVVK